MRVRPGQSEGGFGIASAAEMPARGGGCDGRTRVRNSQNQAQLNLKDLRMIIESQQLNCTLLHPGQMMDRRGDNG